VGKDQGCELENESSMLVFSRGKDEEGLLLTVVFPAFLVRNPEPMGIHRWLEA